ncbi:MAG: hypothetical protein NZM25_05945 [Leptospiraceae bacterium]|nr:hypothetical protein [Leptospiraceae bacterium]
MRPLSNFLLCTTLLFAQSKARTSLEEELPAESIEKETHNKGDPEKKWDEKVVVEGEDELLFQHQKEEAKPDGMEIPTTPPWQESLPEIARNEKQKPPEAQRQAQLRAHYGSYHNLSADIYVTKRDNFGVYLIEYNRLKYDSEGRDLRTIPNSEYSSDRLLVSSGFHFTESYKMLLKMTYKDYLRGLQENPAYVQQFRRGGFFELNQQIRSSEFQRLTIDLGGEYISSSVEENTTERLRDDSTFLRLTGGFDWQYIFSNRNALQLSASLWYAENYLYQNRPRQYYRAGDFKLQDVLPLYRTVVGNQRLPWQIDFTFGVQVFFAQTMRPVWGPILAIDSFLGSWYSRLEIQRIGRIPPMQADFLDRHYSLPVHYVQPEDVWSASSKNSLRLGRANTLKMNVGYVHYLRYWDRNFDRSSELLSARERLFRFAFAEVGWEHSVQDIFSVELGPRYEYQLERVTLRTPFSFFAKASLTPGSWIFYLESNAQYERYVPDANQTLAPFFLLHAGIEKKLNPTVSLFFRGENLLNENYILVYPYRTSGLLIFGGMSISL